MKRFILQILLVIPIGLFSQEFHNSFRNIGPANQGGRIVDIEALETDFTKVYVATASGGVWFSSNAGTTWKPVFDDYETASIGDIAIHQSYPHQIWVGTGEANNRNSVSWGNGIYLSTDSGETFQNKGLESTHAIARVITHPNDSNDICVCATGHLWGYSGERGVFQTSDQGISWKKLTEGLPNDGKTGCTDLVRHPDNPNILFAAMYHRLRKPWHFHSGGENGGVYKSIDNGKSWMKLTNGLPDGPTGRIGLAVSRSNPDIMMAIVEAKKSNSLDTLGSGIYRSEDGGESWTYVNTYNNRPFYYSQIRINPLNDQIVYVLTTRFMVSMDGGSTFQDGSQDQEVHGDFHALWSDPLNADRYYLGADKGLSITHDHGQSFRLIDNLSIAQFYRIGYDYQDPYFVYGGLQDNGMYGMPTFTRDARGTLNDDNWKLHWGDGQYVMADPTDWKTVYTSTEKGGFFKYNAQTYEIQRISPTRATIMNYEQVQKQHGKDEPLPIRFNWTAPLHISSHNPKTLFVAGNYLFRSTNQGGTWEIISPDLSTNHPIKSQTGKSGGITPDNSGAEYHCAITTISVSSISEDVIWAGTDDGNVWVTKNGGYTWSNLTTQINKPDSIWISRIEASHFDLGTAYLTIDGHRSDIFEPMIFKTDNFGATWESLIGDMNETEVTRVIREDLVNPNLLFVGTETGVWHSTNGGLNWRKFTHGIPTVSVYDIQIHPRDMDLIIGTHGRGIYILDNIRPLQQLHEIGDDQSIHLYDQEVATIWENRSRGGQRGHFWFAGENPEEIVNTTTLPRAGFDSYAAIDYYVNDTKSDSLELVITDLTGHYQRLIKLPSKKGIHRYFWDKEFDLQPFPKEDDHLALSIIEELLQIYNTSGLRRMKSQWSSTDSDREKREIMSDLAERFPSVKIPEYLQIARAKPGTYRITLKWAGESHYKSLTIREDPLKMN